MQFQINDEVQHGQCKLKLEEMHFLLWAWSFLISSIDLSLQQKACLPQVLLSLGIAPWKSLFWGDALCFWNVAEKPREKLGFLFTTDMFTITLTQQDHHPCPWEILSWVNLSLHHHFIFHWFSVTCGTMILVWYKDIKCEVTAAAVGTSFKEHTYQKNRYLRFL